MEKFYEIEPWGQKKWSGVMRHLYTYHKPFPTSRHVVQTPAGSEAHNVNITVV